MFCYRPGLTVIHVFLYFIILYIMHYTTRVLNSIIQLTINITDQNVRFINLKLFTNLMSWLFLKVVQSTYHILSTLYYIRFRKNYKIYYICDTNFRWLLNEFRSNYFWSLMGYIVTVKTTTNFKSLYNKVIGKINKVYSNYFTGVLRNYWW